MQSHLALALSALASLTLPLAAQTTWYVDSIATPPGNGMSGSPYASIQYALSQASTVHGDTVLVLPGTYVENLDFLGKAVRLVSSGGPTVTVIDGGAPLVELSAVTFASGEGPGSVLQGFTVENGSGHLGRIVHLHRWRWREDLRCLADDPRLRVSAERGLPGSGVFSENGSPRIEDRPLSNNNIFRHSMDRGRCLVLRRQPLAGGCRDRGQRGGGLGARPVLRRLDAQPAADHDLRTTGPCTPTAVASISCGLPSASFVDCTLFSNSSWGGLVRGSRRRIIHDHDDGVPRRLETGPTTTTTVAASASVGRLFGSPTARSRTTSRRTGVESA